MSTDKKEYGISVIMPCYNTEQYVEETLKSVLNQSFKDYEIICLNDGSTDGTLEILKRYQQSYPNIRVISSENHGVAYQRNTGVQFINTLIIRIVYNTLLIRIVQESTH